MPVFNWEDKSQPTIKPGFKIFWAVAVPLTLLAFVFWLLLMELPWRKWLPKPLAKLGERKEVVVEENVDSDSAVRSTGWGVNGKHCLLLPKIQTGGDVVDLTVGDQWWGKLANYGFNNAASWLVNIMDKSWMPHLLDLLSKSIILSHLIQVTDAGLL